MARRIYLFGLRKFEGLENESGSLALWAVPQTGFDFFRNRLSRHSSSDSDMVPRHVAHLQPKKRNERIGIATRFGPWELPQCLVDVAQIAQGDGSSPP
jgi:hypothetical protein